MHSGAPAPPWRRWIFLGLWLFIALVLWLFRGALAPFAGAALIAYIIAPLIDGLSRARVGRLRMPRWCALFVVYAVFFYLAYLFLTALVPQLYREAMRVSRDLIEFANSLTPERVQQLAQKAEDWLSRRGIPVELSNRALDLPPDQVHHGLRINLEQLLRGGATSFTETVRENLGGVFQFSRRVALTTLTAVLTVFFLLMIAGFLSLDAAQLGRYAQTLLPEPWRPSARALLERIDRNLSGVVRGQLTIALINGVLTFLGLLLFRVKFAFLLATVATVFSLVPVFGTILSSVPILLIALAHSGRSALGMLIWILAIHGLEAYLLGPKIVGAAARVHPVVLTFALIAGEQVGGVLGALFAVPLCAGLVAAFDFARERAQEFPG